MAEMIRIDEKTLLSFWEKVDKSTGCWLWLRSKRGGYGFFRKLQAHRFAYELLVGKIPEHLELDHLCRNRACVNPAHLEPVTHQENVRRGETGINNAIKKACIHGHTLEGDNLYLRRNNKRECKACHRAAMVRFQRKHTLLGKDKAK